MCPDEFAKAIKSIKHTNDYCEGIDASLTESTNELSKLQKELVALVKASGVCPNAECKKNLKKVKKEMEAETDKLQKNVDVLDQMYSEHFKLMAMHSITTLKYG
jgi:regulator of replication initiation timing